MSRKKQSPQQKRFPFYRQDLAGFLEPMAPSYPDTRIYSYLVALELMEGGSRAKAKRHCLDALQRPTRPRNYEYALINAGMLFPDDGEVLNALQLAYQLMAQPVVLPGQSDQFPFATKRRLVYRYHGLERVASVLFDRAKTMFENAESRQILRLRSEVLSFRHSLQPQLFAAGVKEGDPEMTSYPRTLTLDDMMFELVDPEVVLEEERMKTLRRPIRSLLHQMGYQAGLQPLLQAVDSMGSMRSSVRSLHADESDGQDDIDMARIAQEYFDDVVHRRRDPNRRIISRQRPFIRKPRVTGVEQTKDSDEMNQINTEEIAEIAEVEEVEEVEEAKGA
jgi:hypothetical protein